MAKTSMQKHYWTKEEIRTVIKVWEDLSIEQIATKLGLYPLQVQYMANLIRKNGISLPRKHRKGTTDSLVKEVKAELGL